MPTFLIHGFRWNRVHIRVHIILHDLEDAAPDWILAPATSVTLLNSFYTLFDFLPPSNPPPAEYPIALDVVKLLEQYNPENMESASQPYAYVADYMVEVLLGVSITEEMARYEAKVKEEEARLSVPGTPGTPGTAGFPPKATSQEKAGLISPPLSSREIRKRSRRLGWFTKLRDALQAGEEIGWYVVVCGDQERAAPSMVEAREEGSEEDEPQKAPRNAGLRGFFGR
ncbi:hypothetical protein BUE80_DR001854 [Diplocarpon rosae]|nr:hypothetical protein BUE80_DR001854 [Diplocarpon rosae]